MARAAVLFVIPLVLFPASVSHADPLATLGLTTLTPPNAPGGYLPGSDVDFQVNARWNLGSAPIRLLTLDFSASSPELSFNGPNTNGNSVPEFDFDFSSIASGALYAKFLDYPIPNITYTGTQAIEGFVLMLPAAGQGPLTVGTGSIALPMAPGDYLLDAINPDYVNNDNLGARIITTWEPFICDPDPCPTDWDRFSGELLTLTVVPEPATVILLGIGGVTTRLIRLQRRNHRLSRCFHEGIL